MSIFDESAFSAKMSPPLRTPLLIPFRLLAGAFHSIDVGVEQDAAIRPNRRLLATIAGRISFHPSDDRRPVQPDGVDSVAIVNSAAQSAARVLFGLRFSIFSKRAAKARASSFWFH